MLRARCPVNVNLVQVWTLGVKDQAEADDFIRRVRDVEAMPAFAQLPASASVEAGLASPTRFEVHVTESPSLPERRNTNPDSAIVDDVETDEGGVNRVETSQHFTVGAQPEPEE